MKELYIHIGLSKTGSSAIQSWLSLNSEKLKQQGFDYADLNPSAKEGKITAGNGVFLFHACNAENWDEVERLICNLYFKNNNQAIISSETLQGMAPLAIQKIKQVCDKNNISVTVIGYARSAYELLYSNYLQGIKRHGFTFRFGEKEALSYQAQRCYLENYYNVFKQNLKLLNYDNSKENIYKSFSDVIGIVDSFLVVKSKKVNRSLTFTEAEILREMNVLHKGIFSTEISDYLISLFPNTKTDVFYDDELLEKTRVNTKKDIDWINKNILAEHEILKSDQSEQSDQSGQSDQDQSGVIQNIVKWALERNVLHQRVELINFLRDLAVYLENSHLPYAIKLMERAKELRPNGPFIIKKLQRYKAR